MTNIPNIQISSKKMAEQLAEALTVDAIISVGPENKISPPEGLPYLNIGSLLKDTKEALVFADNFYQQSPQGHLLVHCTYGEIRSPTLAIGIVALQLMRQGESLDSAIDQAEEHVLDIQDIARPDSIEIRHSIRPALTTLAAQFKPQP